jgi:hypothetical protein
MNMQTAVELTTVPVIRRAWAEASKAAAFTVSDTFAANAVNRLLSRYYTIRCKIASEFFGQNGAVWSPRLRNDDALNNPARVMSNSMVIVRNSWKPQPTVRMYKSFAGRTFGGFQEFPCSMCKLAKLSFVAGAEIPKRYVLT